MNPELEQEIQKLLQGLPDLAAPPRLLARTMAAINKPAPGFIRPWRTWPLSARVGFVVLTLAIKVGVVAAL